MAGGLLVFRVASEKASALRARPGVRPVRAVLAVEPKRVLIPPPPPKQKATAWVAFCFDLAAATEQTAENIMDRRSTVYDFWSYPKSYPCKKLAAQTVPVLF